MNLVNNPFFRVMMKDGSRKHISLREAFEMSENIACIDENFPTTVSLMSVLVGIAQAVFGFCKDEAAWANVKGAIIPSCIEYLTKWQCRFDLFDKKYPFGQFPFLKETYAASPFKSTFSFENLQTDRPPTGSHSHIMHCSEKRPWILSPAEIAINIITIQSFDAGGTNKKFHPFDSQVEKTRKECSPLCKKLLLIAQGECLLDTIHLNLAIKTGDEKLGKPYWELNLKSCEDFQQYTRTYFGRLLPICRAILLLDQNSQEMLFTAFPEELSPILHHPFVVLGKKEAASVREDTHVWRSLGAALANGLKEGLPFGVTRGYAGNKFFWVGGVGMDSGGKGSKLAAPVLSVLNCHSEDPRYYFDNLVSAVKIADEWATRLMSGMGLYKAIASPSSFKRSKILNGFSDNARMHFWDTLSKRIVELLEYRTNGSTAGGSGTEETNAIWNRVCLKAATESYDLYASIKRVGDHEAYAKGFRQMFAWSPKEGKTKKVRKAKK